MTHNGKLKIMVVDDHADTLDSLGHLMRRWGYEVIEAREGKEALAKHSSEHPDVVLLDLGLPGITGFDVAQEIRSREAFIRPILIAHTGHNRPLHEQLTHEVGFDFMAVKPVPPESLKKLLEWFS